MRVITAKQLEQEPYGTVYSNFTPNVFGELAVKSEQRGHGTESWWAVYVTPFFENDGDMVGEIDNKSTLVLGKEVIMSTTCTDDASYNYDEDSLFAVFNNREVRDMISVLENALEQIGDKDEATIKV